eukprot:gnl/Chilomastix_cuspidata/156.p2 GENE.gnl/Chilomastix_cuspidata/156~~gnl/Chilomastix_cuspidata/156.p2  ORF type:complete len:913 (-),score=536.23 gnl/Chilomastix_cuspidata/156:2065-4803(-)
MARIYSNTGGMDEVYPTGEWDPLGNVFYRQENVYTMAWPYDTDISSQIVKMAPGGGALAMTRDPSKLISLKRGSALPKVGIFRADGKKLSEFNLEETKVVDFHWSDREHLYIIAEDGVLYIYTPLLEKPREPIELDRSIRERGVSHCTFFDNGVVLLAKDHTLLYYRDLLNPHIHFLKEPHALKGEAPTFMAVLSPRISPTGEIRVLFGTGEGRIVSVTNTGVRLEETVHLPGPAVRAAVDRTAGWIALWVDLSRAPEDRRKAPPPGDDWMSDEAPAAPTVNDGRGELWVLDPTYQPKMEPMKFTRKPPRVSWVGRDCIALAWEESAILVGPGGLTLELGPFDSEVHLCQEVDGMRVISNSRHVFVHRVSDAAARALSIGSVENASLLLQAYFANREGSAGADELRRVVMNRAGGDGGGFSESGLLAACKDLVEAARVESSPIWQRMLMFAASYGRVFVSEDASAARQGAARRRKEPVRDLFVRTCHELRVMNTLAEASGPHSVAMPMTPAQFAFLKGEALVERLVGRKEFFLGWRVCDELALREPRGALLVRWALAKIESADEPNEKRLSKVLLERLSQFPGVSFLPVVKLAHDRALMDLAKGLLEFEPSTANQVEMYLEIRDFEKALEKARESTDQSLEEEVLLRAQTDLCGGDVEEFARWLVRNEATASRAATVFLSYARRTDNELFTEMAVKVNKIDEAVEGTIRAFFATASMKIRKNRLSAVEEACKTRFEDPHKATLLADELYLLEKQEEYAPVLDKQLVGLTVDDTLFALLLAGHAKKAEEISQRLDVSALRWQALNIRYYVRNQAWRELEKFADKAKIDNWWPFFTACARASAFKHAAHFAKKMADPMDRVRAYLQIEEFQEAVDQCGLIDDTESLYRLMRETDSAKSLQCLQKVIEHREGGAQ